LRRQGQAGAILKLHEALAAAAFAALRAILTGDLDDVEGVVDHGASAMAPPTP
jgi:hypothetical protein